MTKNRITVSFENIHQLWVFAQTIKASNIEIITSQKILICDCSEEDLALLPKYNGRVISDSSMRFSRENTEATMRR